jgi:hypothetical protein
MDLEQQERGGWPMRPWAMAGIGAAAGLLFDGLTDYPSGGLPRPGMAAAATFVAIASVSFVLTAEKLRWWWSAAFAVGWGLIVALIGWFTARYNSNPTIFEWPFFSGIFAVLLAAPLFQTVRDEGRWHFPYATLHRHVWIDAVIGAASLFFTGLSFLLGWLIAGLFSLIGVDVFADMLKESAFAWMLAGFAFGGAVGLLREREKLLGTLYRLVTAILSVLAPVLAAALVLFLLSLPITGLKELWDSDVPATPLLLLAAAGAFALANAVLGDDEAEEPPSELLHWSALALIAAILPLALVAALSIGERIEQYGWTPERIWGVLAVAVALAYGAAGWWSIARGRQRFDRVLRPLQTALAIGLCGVALFLALPILDFGAISASSQLARLQKGKVELKEFDWRAMAYDFGPSGRKRLQELAKSGPGPMRKLAAAALTANRYEVEPAIETAVSEDKLDEFLRVVPDGAQIPRELRDVVARSRYCRGQPCVLTIVDERRAILAGKPGTDTQVQSMRLKLREGGTWNEYDNWNEPPFPPPSVPLEQPDVAKGEVEVREVTRRQLFIDGRPVGDVFE